MIQESKYCVIQAITWKANGPDAAFHKLKEGLVAQAIHDILSSLHTHKYLGLSFFVPQTRVMSNITVRRLN